jgi:hypothetical protein
MDLRETLRIKGATFRKGQNVRLRFDFDSQGDAKKLSAKAGEIIVFLSNSEKGWARGKIGFCFCFFSLVLLVYTGNLNGKIGFFPLAFVVAVSLLFLTLLFLFFHSFE